MLPQLGKDSHNPHVTQTEAPAISVSRCRQETPEAALSHNSKTENYRHFIIWWGYGRNLSAQNRNLERRQKAQNRMLPTSSRKKKDCSRSFFFNYRHCQKFRVVENFFDEIYWIFFCFFFQEDIRDIFQRPRERRANWNLEQDSGFHTIPTYCVAFIGKTSDFIESLIKKDSPSHTSEKCSKIYSDL